jgi:hypothetical protein
MVYQCMHQKGGLQSGEDFFFEAIHWHHADKNRPPPGIEPKKDKNRQVRADKNRESWPI